MVFHDKLIKFERSQAKLFIMNSYKIVDTHSHLCDHIFDSDRTEVIERLANLLADTSLYIGNDSGVSHFAGILGVPAIVFYKITDPEVWGALGRNVAHIKASNEKSALNSIFKFLPARP